MPIKEFPTSLPPQNLTLFLYTTQSQSRSKSSSGNDKAKRRICEICGHSFVSKAHLAIHDRTVRLTSDQHCPALLAHEKLTLDLFLHSHRFIRGSSYTNAIFANPPSVRSARWLVIRLLCTRSVETTSARIQAVKSALGQGGHFLCMR